MPLPLPDRWKEYKGVPQARGKVRKLILEEGRASCPDSSRSVPGSSPSLPAAAASPTTPSTIRSLVPSPPVGSVVSVHYVGRFAHNGKIFDSSRERSKPIQFTVGKKEVIRGWDLALPTFRVGERSLVYCASSYAYGAKGVKGEIKPNTALLFEIELLGYEPAPPCTEGKKK